MAKVLQNFLIGVGLDTEQYDKGAKNVESSLSRMRTLVGFTGTAISGAFGLAGTAAINAGKRVLDFNNAAEKLKTPTDYVWNYGRALAALGGNAEDALTSINAAENALTQFELKGEFAPFNEAALAGVRDELNALMSSPDGGELLRGLSGVVPRLDKYQQRLIKDAFSLSDTVMILLNSGTEAFDASIARAGELYGEFGRAADEAREFARAVAEINTRFQGIGETLAEKMLPGFTGVVDSLGGFIDRNRDLIDRTIKDKPEASALVGTSAAAIGAGAAASTIGLRTLGGLAMRGGVAGMAIGAGLIAADMRPDDIEDITGYRPNDYIFDNTPLDAVRDAYNAVADKYGFERSEKGSGAISYLEGSYGRLNDQISSFESYLLDYAASGGRNREAEQIASPQTDYLPLNQINYHEGDPRRLVESATSGFVSPYEIYGGGEISNSEAASANPDVIMVQVQREQADRPLTTPRINVENHLEVQMEMDGRAVDTRVIDVIERRERDIMDDIYSSVDR